MIAYTIPCIHSDFLFIIISTNATKHRHDNIKQIINKIEVIINMKIVLIFKNNFYNDCISRIKAFLIIACW